MVLDDIFKSITIEHCMKPKAWYSRIGITGIANNQLFSLIKLLFEKLFFVFGLLGSHFLVKSDREKLKVSGTFDTITPVPLTRPLSFLPPIVDFSMHAAFSSLRDSGLTSVGFALLKIFSSDEKSPLGCR